MPGVEWDIYNETINGIRSRVQATVCATREDGAVRAFAIQILLRAVVPRGASKIMAAALTPVHTVGAVSDSYRTGVVPRFHVEGERARMECAAVFTGDLSLKVLVVDDDATLRASISSCLDGYGCQVTAVSNGNDALVQVSDKEFDLVLLDVYLGACDGTDLIEQILSAAPWLSVVMMSGYPSIENAVRAIRFGACDYLEKPFTADELAIAAYKAGETARHRRRLEARRRKSETTGHAVPWSSECPAMKRLLKQAEQVAVTDASVLLRGEHGTGKTVLARAIHHFSKRGDQPLGIVSCPSLSSQLLESELFGHVRGAFTGAIKDNPGRVARCDGGTLFLDEIGDLPAEIQPKLLRFLQDKEYEPVGDARTRHADVRLITATNVDIERAVSEGRLREDLLYRLNVVEIHIPPLRERRDDIPILAEQILAELTNDDSGSVTGFTADALGALMGHDWPGNVRELRNAIERAMVFSTNGRITADLLLGHRDPGMDAPRVGDAVSLATLEEHHIRRVLASSRSLKDAARILGIDETTLWRRRKEYNI